MGYTPDYIVYHELVMTTKVSLLRQLARHRPTAPSLPFGISFERGGLETTYLALRGVEDGFQLAFGETYTEFAFKVYGLGYASRIVSDLPPGRSNLFGSHKTGFLSGWAFSLGF